MKKNVKKTEGVRDMLAEARHIPGVEHATAEDIRKADEKLRRWVRSQNGGGLRPSDDKKSERWRSYLVDVLRARGVKVGAVAQAAEAEKAGEQAGDPLAAVNTAVPGTGGLVHFSFMPEEADSELCGEAEGPDLVSGYLSDVDCEKCLARVIALARIGCGKAGSGGCKDCDCGGHDAQTALEEMTDRLNDADAEVCRLRSKRGALARSLELTANALMELANSEQRGV